MEPSTTFPDSYGKDNDVSDKEDVQREDRRPLEKSAYAPKTGRRGYLNTRGRLYRVKGDTDVE